MTFAKALSPMETPTIVAHLSDDMDSEKNLRYIDYLLNLFEQTSFKARLALENLHDPPLKYDTITLKSLIDRFHTDRLGLCLDIPNHVLSGESDIAIPPIHMHMHGFTEMKRHLGLDPETSRLSHAYCQHYPVVPCILELLDLPDYLTALEQYCKYLKKMRSEDRIIF